MTQPLILPASALTLRVEMRFSGHTLGSASGFVVVGPAGPVLITNRHVVTGRHQDTNVPIDKQCGLPDELVIRHHLGELGTFGDRVEPLFDVRRRPLWKEHPILSARADVIALPITNTAGGVMLRPLSSLPNHGVPQPTLMCSDLVRIIGFPFGKDGGGFPIWTTGFVASEPQLLIDSLPLFLVDSRTRPGQSGSPVVMHTNAGPTRKPDGSLFFVHGPTTWFLGVYSGRIHSESDVGRVWTAACVYEVVERGVASSTEHPHGSLQENDEGSAATPVDLKRP